MKDIKKVVDKRGWYLVFIIRRGPKTEKFYVHIIKMEEIIRILCEANYIRSEKHLWKKCVI